MRGWGRGWGACVALVLAACGGPLEEAPAGGPSETAPLTVVPEAEPRGETRWLQSLEGAGKEFAAGLAHDSSGNVLVAVNVNDAMADGEGALYSYAPDTFMVVKYGPGGERVWSFRLPGFAEALTVDSRSRVIVAGRNPAGADFGAGALPAGRFVLVLDRDGDLVWARSLESLGVSASFEPKRADADRWGNVALAGALPDPVRGGVAALVKLDADGRVQWTYADRRPGASHGVAVDNDGFLYLAGVLREAQPGETDFVPYLVRLDPAGQVVWERRIETEYGGATGVAVHGNRVLVSGGFIKPLTFGGRQYTAKGSWSDAFVAAYDRNGSERWVRVLGWVGLDVSMDYDDGAVVIGKYEDGDDLGFGPVAGVPGVQSNLFVAKLDRVDGALRWVRGFPMDHPANTDVSQDRFFVSSDASRGLCAVVGARLAPTDFGTGMMAAPRGGRRDLFLGGFER